MYYSNSCYRASLAFIKVIKTNNNNPVHTLHGRAIVVSLLRAHKLDVAGVKQAMATSPLRILSR